MSKFLIKFDFFRFLHQISFFGFLLLIGAMLSFVLVILPCLFLETSVSAASNTDYYCQSHWTNSSCSSFLYPNSDSEAQLSELCKEMEMGPACSISSYCANVSMTTGYCQPFSIYGDACVADMTSLSGCAPYNGLCNASTVITQCSSEMPIPNLPTSVELDPLIRSICTSDMARSCYECNIQSSTLMTCDLLKFYSILCFDNQKLTECAAWTEFCKSVPTWQYCTGFPESPTATPSTNGAAGGFKVNEYLWMAGLLWLVLLRI